MSITDVKPDYDLEVSTDYLVFGVGTKKRKHKAAGSNRIVRGFYCDAPSVKAFVALGHELAKKHSRKVKAQSYVLSFSPEEFSVKNPHDLQRVGDAAFLLAKKMHPHSPCMIVVHDDGKGHAPHAHIKVLNHDTSTGKALRDFRVHWQVKKANDELMRELGLDVLEARPKQRTDDWLRRREGMPAFDQELGDLCAAAKAEALATTLAESTAGIEDFTTRFKASCRTRGIVLVVDQHEIKSGNRRGKERGETALGYTFKMRDETGLRPRLRRRKASALSWEFTHDSIAAELISARSAQTAVRPLAVSASLLLERPARRPYSVDVPPVDNSAATQRSRDDLRASVLAALDSVHAESQLIADERIRKFRVDRVRRGTSAEVTEPRQDPPSTLPAADQVMELFVVPPDDVPNGDNERHDASEADARTRAPMPPAKEPRDEHVSKASGEQPEAIDTGKHARAVRKDLLRKELLRRELLRDPGEANSDEANRVFGD